MNIITVTLNPALDKTVMIEQLKPGGLNRVEEIRMDPGGKGINVAKVLKSFPVNVLATGINGGYAGRQLLDHLERLQISHRFSTSGGETRTNLKIVDRKTEVTTEINEKGTEVSAETIRHFRREFTGLLDEASLLVIGGSLPPGISPQFYAEIIREAEKKGVQTVLDADGEAFRAGLEASPSVVKPNIHELEQYLERALNDEDQVVDACRELLAKGISWVIVSMGGEGAILVSEDEVIRGRPFPIRPVSTVGAGDSMVAVIAFCLLENKNLEETARWATAAGTITASKPGTGVCRYQEVQEHLALVQTERWT